MTTPHVAIAGGGLAGLAAALRLSDAGVRVTLLESRRRLGGRAASFADAQSGEELDNCQHVTMGCCSRYIALLERLGASSMLAWHDRQCWITPDGKRSTIAPSAWAASLLGASRAHAPSFLRASFLTAKEKLAIARALQSMRSLDRSSLAPQTFSRWLRDHHQPQGAIDKFWRTVVVSACNLEPDALAASAAIHVFQGSLLSGPNASRIGVPVAPLSRLYEALPAALSRSAGVVHLGATVEHLNPTCVNTTTQPPLACDAAICALPFEKALRVIPPALQSADPRFAAMQTFSHSPILGVHLWFDRPVLDVPHAVLVNTPTQWLFRKDDPGTRIHAVISAADDWINLSDDAIAQRVLADIHACLPHTKGLAPTRVRPVRERFATFACTPAFLASRPANTGPSRVILAGDYTDTGWPATMEGAVISGELAADAALASLRVPSQNPNAL